MDDNKKVVIVGTGFVGMSCAYALLNQNACDELVLIDVNKEKAKGEAMDLNHSLAFSPAEMKIYAGDYPDCKDADIIVIAAGVNQKEGETRIDLLKRNKNVFVSVIQPVIDSGFDGIFLIATNPVDIMTKITLELSGFSPSRVIGSGTTLDTARLRYMISEKVGICPKDIEELNEYLRKNFDPWKYSDYLSENVQKNNTTVLKENELHSLLMEAVRKNVQRINEEFDEEYGEDPAWWEYGYEPGREGEMVHDFTERDNFERMRINKQHREMDALANQRRNDQYFPEEENDDVRRWINGENVFESAPRGGYSNYEGTDINYESIYDRRHRSPRLRSSKNFYRKRSSG